MLVFCFAYTCNGIIIPPSCFPRETNGEINQLSIVSTNEEGTFTQSEYHSYLTDSVVVTGGLIVSKGGCALYNMEINVTVSTVRTDAGEFGWLVIRIIITLHCTKHTC